MSKERVVRATWADGTTTERGSVGRVYGFAWRVAVKYTEKYKAERIAAGWRASDGFEQSGFSSTRPLAEKAAAAFKYENIAREVVAVEVIEKRTRKEGA